MTFASGATTLTINRCHYPVTQSVEHRDTVGETENGTVYAYDFDTDIRIIKMQVSGDETFRAALESFYLTTVNGRTNTFTVTPDSGINLGAGAGAVITARFWDNGIDEVLSAWNLYRMQITIRRV